MYRMPRKPEESTMSEHVQTTGRQSMDVDDGDFHVEVYGKEQGFPPDVRRRLFLYSLKNNVGRTTDGSF